MTTLKSATTASFLLLLAALLLAPGCSLSTGDAPSVLSPSASPADPVAYVLQSTVEVRALFEDGRGALGTGVVVSDDGVIVTNDHVLLAGGDVPPRRVVVVTADGRQADAGVVHRAAELDLAFLRAEVDGVAPARFQSDLSDVERGDDVFAVGAPRHFDEAVARGTVRRVVRRLRIPERPDLDTLIVTDAPLEQGFSVGPLADERGRVVGVNVAGVEMTGMEGERSLAIPAATVLQEATEAGLLRE